MIRIFTQAAVLAFQFLIITCLQSCETLFSYSPYEGQLDQKFYGTTEKNLDLINRKDTEDSKPFKIALFSDTHYHFNKLHDALVHINEKEDISFAVVIGDIHLLSTGPTLN